MVEPTPLKNMLVKMGSSSPNRGENKKYLKPPPRLSSIINLSYFAGSSVRGKQALLAWFSFPIKRLKTVGWVVDHHSRMKGGGCCFKGV